MTRNAAGTKAPGRKSASARSASGKAPVLEAPAGKAAGRKSALRKPHAVSATGTTSNAILEAALVLFARDGFDGASLPAIAKAAGIGHPLIHYHFGSKEKLWRAAVDYAFAEFGSTMELLEDASCGLQPLETLTLLCRGFAQFTARHPSHTLIILGEVRIGGERFDWLVEQHLRPMHARLDRVIAAAVAAGQLRPIPPVHLATILVGAIVHFFGAAPLMKHLYDVDVREPHAIEAHSSWVLEVLMRGLATAADRESPTVSSGAGAARPKTKN